MLLEEKTRRGQLSKWFQIFIKTVLHPALVEYCANNAIDYRGYYVVEFENTSPENGRIWICEASTYPAGKEEITAQALQNMLSLRYPRNKVA